MSEIHPVPVLLNYENYGGLLRAVWFAASAHYGRTFALIVAVGSRDKISRVLHQTRNLVEKL